MMADKGTHSYEDRFDLPERTRACRMCGWETWDGECWECFKREGKPNRYGVS